MKVESSITLISSEYLKPFWQHNQIYQKQTSRHLFGIYNYNYLINTEKLKNSLQMISNRNYNLRSNFIQEDAELKQIIKNDSEAKLAVYTVSSALERIALLQNLVAKPFNLSHENLYRAYLIKNNTNNQSTLLVVFHHIILDGAQFDSIMNELVACYRGDSLPQPTDIQELEDYLHVEKRNIDNANTDFWLKQLADYPLQINFKNIDKKLPSSRQKTSIKAFRLNTNLTKSIITFTKENNISMFNFLKIMWATLIGRSCSQEKLIIVHAVSTRTTAFSSLKGSYINVIPFSIDLNTSLNQQITKLNTSLIDSKTHRFMPTQKIIESLHQKNKGARLDGIFNVVIAQTDLRINPPMFNAEDKNATASLTPNIGSALLLLEYQIIDDSLQYHINFLSPAFSDDYVDKLGEDFKNIILSGINNIDTTLMKLPLQTCNDEALIPHQECIDFYQRAGSHW